MKTEIVIKTSSENETARLGAAVAQALEPGDVVCLRGNLGAGKTVMARAIARGLGVDENITSPTFVIMNRYDTPRGDGLFHFDLYRNPDAQEYEDLGFAEILRGGGFCVVEWAENLPEGMAESAAEIEITASGEDENAREIQISVNEKKAAVITGAMPEKTRSH